MAPFAPSARRAGRHGAVRPPSQDDGLGGARIDAGTGLRGLQDRLAALDGTLVVESPRGGGTRLTARIPCGADALVTEARETENGPAAGHAKPFLSADRRT